MKTDKLDEVFNVSPAEIVETNVEEPAIIKELKSEKTDTLFKNLALPANMPG